MNKNKFFKFSKIIYILFIFYIGWFQYVFFQIPYMPLILGSGMIILLLLYVISRKGTVVVTKPIFIWLLFSFYLLLSGLFIAYDINHLLDSWLTYNQILAMMIYIINVSEIHNDNTFFVKTYILYCIVYMVTMLFFGFEGWGGRLYLSETSNPNGDAITLLYGIFCVLIITDVRKIGKFLISVGLVSLFIYSIILTGSRKSFLAAILLSILWFVFVYKYYWKSYRIINKIIALLIMSVIIVLIGYRFLPVFLDSPLYLRLIREGYTIASDQTRSGMYKEAFRLFYNNPLFGIGYDHYRILSGYGTYSHSTYAEIIATTGLTGTIIYAYAYLIIICNLLYLYIRKKGTDISIKSLQYLILMFVMLVLGLGVIHFYEIVSNMMFAIMISFYYTERKKLSKPGEVLRNG